MKKLLYPIIIFLIFFNCSNDDGSSNETCYIYSIFVSDDCNCVSMDFNCGDLKFISESEYDRLFEIQQNSTEDCIYIQSEESSSGLSFEGFIIILNKNRCPFSDDGPLTG